MGGCRVHGVGGCGDVGGGGVHGGVGGWRVHGVGAYPTTHEQLQCQNISSCEHPPTHQTYPKHHSVTIHILWMVHGVDGGWWWGGWRVHGVGEWVVACVLGEFMGWVVVGWMVGGFMGWVGV